ncbi:DUF3027 domain-containing protein [Actinophytocola sp. KF-1]
MNVQQSDLIDPALVGEVDLARAAAQEEAGDERVGDYVEYQIEDSAAVTHLFEADKPGYRGWRWAVTITSAGPDTDVTVSEVVLLPGPTALVAPEWIPWQERVQAGDLGVGDLLPTSPDDPRLVPAYVASDDPAVEEVAAEAGLGRVRVMSRPARLDAADRWLASDFGPRSDMARSAPAHCGTCGFYLPLAGSLRAAFGTCGNEFAPADGHVVHVEYGCGAHSEAEVEQVSPVLVADLIYDDAQLDVEPLTVVDEVPAAVDEAPGAADSVEAESPASAEADDSGAMAGEAVVAGPSGEAAVDGVEPVEAASSDSADAGSGEAGVPEAEVAESSGEAAVGAVEPAVEVSPVSAEIGSDVPSGEVGAAEAETAASSGEAAVGAVEPAVEVSPVSAEAGSGASGEAGAAEAEVAESSGEAAVGAVEPAAEVSPVSAEIGSDVPSGEVGAGEASGEVAVGESPVSAEAGSGVPSGEVGAAEASGEVAVGESPVSVEADSGAPGEAAESAPTSGDVADVPDAEAAGNSGETAEPEAAAVAEPVEAQPGESEAPGEPAVAVVEAAAPAAIEPVVTGETAGNDEPASRE